MARKPSIRRNFVKASRRPARQTGLWGKDTLLIERMSQEGRGVARRDGKTVFVTGALRGETVRVQCTAVKRDYDEADTLEIAAETAPSAARIAPECPLFQQCGGCSLQHWSAPAQLQHKAENLLALLRPIAPELSLDPPLTSPPRGFRHRLRLTLDRGPDDRYSLGLRQRRSHRSVAVDHCTVADAAVNAALKQLPGLLSAWPPLQGLRELEIDADSNGDLGLCFYLAANPGEKAVHALREAVLAGPFSALRVRLARPGGRRREEPLGDANNEDSTHWQELAAAGELCLRLPATASDTADTLRLGYLPGDFTQTHWDVNAALIARALDWLQPAPNERALDLFSGIGNFTLPLARRVASVLALEGDAAMTLRLAANACHNGIDNIEAKTRNLMAPELTLPRADLAIVDPPRAGAMAVCEALARARVGRLLYISCHPATLARDARALQGAGYVLSRAAAVDMFPHTGHGEAVALFSRQSKR